MKRRLKIAAYRLSQSDILFWTLPAIMILLAVGTIAQKTVGLYAAQSAYFSSFITFIGPVPFPGGYTLIGILFLNLLMKFLFFSEWRLRKSGIILTHFGVLILLGGGMITAMTQKEGYMVLGQGETSNKIEDYHQRMLMILKNDQHVEQIPFQNLKEGKPIPNFAFPFFLTIDQACYNCRIERRANGTGWQGPGRFMSLRDTKEDAQDEMNLSGVEFTISGTKDDGKYLAFDKFPKPPRFKINNDIYTIVLGRAQRQLPFSVTLQNFTAQFYPGTTEARAYRSDLLVEDGVKWPATIEMNKPLRYKGYTLYQSSFDTSGQQAATILNIVENKGRIFPYISSLVIALGLILHLFLRRIM